MKKKMKSVTETVESNRSALAKMPRHYEIKVTDIMEIADQNEMKLSENIVNAIETAYRYGVIRGRRYEKNRAKAKH